ncbi:2-hydroxyglutaryl-CoA dehydratase [Deltaproteobacteria bacterium Smac51]|nr:2-hydroxyglutaryl-CoA dehydratase [Deltaproteobacteria bacterium Smac51]
MNIISLDIGSVATKGVVWSAAEGRLLAAASVPSAWQPNEAAMEVLRKLLDQAVRPVRLAVTGYGRNLLTGSVLTEALEFSEATEPLVFNEITALAKAMARAAPEVRLVLDVGGQDSKALLVDAEGRVLDFMLNDKCAAGAGAFIDSVCHSFNLTHESFSQLAGEGRPVALSSMCAVFAQTELVAQIAKGVRRADLAAGIMASLAARLKAQCGRLFTGGPVALTGGLSRLPVFVKYLADVLEAPVIVPPDAPYLAAVGAAQMAAAKLSEFSEPD